MGLAQQLNQTTILTPQERERNKTAQQHAEDAIYILNHTFTCIGLTDAIILPLLQWLGFDIGHSHGEKGLFSGLRGKKAPTDAQAAEGTARYKDMCGIAGHPSTPHNHAPAELSFFQKIVWKIKNVDWAKVRHWMMGEAFGDIGAAIVTIPIQRHLPGFMDALRRGMEPVVGGFFRHGAARAAHKWADKHGVEYSSQDVVDRAEKLYHYEMQHLPQMAVWTATSIGLHYGAMKGYLEKDITLGQFARMKAAGAGITAALVFGARALAPDKAHYWDETAGKHVVVPLTKTVGKLFGIKEQEVDDYNATRVRDETPQGWAERVARETPASFAARIL